MQATYPESTEYLDMHLTPNVHLWAGFRHTRFSTGAVSTQRGEGLNKHFKVHLSAQSPLNKLFDEACLRENKEAARLFLSEVRDEMHATQARTYSSSCYPDIIAEMEVLLTGYGLSFIQKQISSGAHYAIQEVDLGSDDEVDRQDTPLSRVQDFPHVDPDVVDHPRQRTARDLLSTLPEEQQAEVKTFRLKLLHTITDKPKNP